MGVSKLLAAGLFTLVGLISVSWNCVADEQDSKKLAEEEIILDSAGVQLAVEDIERYILENIPPERRAGVLARPNVFKEMVETLFVIKSLATEATAHPDFDQRQARWAAQMVLDRRLVNEFRSRYVGDLMQDIDWDAIAKETYAVEKQSYKTTERVGASHILLKAEGRSVEEARALIAELRQRALDGEDFAALALEYSDDPSAKNNSGSLGYFGRGKMVPAFEETAFAMQEVGEISDIVESQFGLHIIRLDGKEPAGVKPFEDVKQEIIDSAMKSRANQLWQDKVIRVRSAAGSYINEAAIDGLKEKYKVKPDALPGE